jgi:hypothetical protein
MDKKSFVALAVMMFASWRFHPGNRVNKFESFSEQEIAFYFQLAEALWAHFGAE